MTDVNPRNLKNKMIKMHEHKMFLLNPEYVNEETPEPIRDWMMLIKESIKNPTQPNINMGKKAIVKAAKLADVSEVSPEELAEAKIQEQRKLTIVKIQEDSRQDEKEKGIRKALKRGKLTLLEIAEDFEVDLAFVKKIREEMT